RVRGLEVGNQKPSNPQSLIPNPFVVRTPTAVVTDLGTEFGVEVDENGNTTSHVFRGAVELRAINGKRPGAAPTEGSGTVLLKAGEGARVERRTDSSLTIRRSTMEDSDAISLRPRMRSRIDVFSTGVGLKEGDIDPRWQIVARSDAADFEPRPAAVTSITYGTFRVNDPARSQWISVAGDLPDLPPVSYTFRTTFELNGVSLETVVLQGRFIADNHVDAIRINGRSVPVPDHGYEKPFYAFHPFAIKDGFVEGTNVLEFEVSNTSPDSRPTLVSPMILRVELYGSAFRGRQAAPAASKNELEQKGKSKGGKHTDGT
ncbi:MAG: FecR domain-containing protein, partial [Pirellulales bacterium]|nr:FecR domain-containing protein [Pirellulales bacterium]